MSGKPIPEAVERARQCIVMLRQHLALFVQDDVAQAMFRDADEVVAALTAAQQQGQAQGGGEVEPDGYTSYGEFRWACDCDERQRREWTPVYLAPPSAPVDDALLDRLAGEVYRVHCDTPIRAFPNDTHWPKWRAVVQHVANALAQQPSVPTLAKHQPCGCVICTCEDEKQCQGCGAKFCGNRTDHPAYVKQQPEANAERAFFAQDFYEEARKGKKPWPSQQPAAMDGAMDRERTLTAVRFRAACYALKEAVEGPTSEVWRSESGERLKDRPEWVAFYNLVSDMRERGGPDPYAQPGGSDNDR